MLKRVGKNHLTFHRQCAHVPGLQRVPARVTRNGSPAHEEHERHMSKKGGVGDTNPAALLPRRTPLFSSKNARNPTTKARAPVDDVRETRRRPPIARQFATASPLKPPGTPIVPAGGVETDTTRT